MRIANEFSLKKKTGMTVSDEQNSIHTEDGNMSELHDDMLQKVVGGTEINESELNGILLKDVLQKHFVLRISDRQRRHAL